jgi:3-dehydrosphinganine reductase
VTRIGGAHAIVTGGSSGIGLEVAAQLVGRGARVSLVARDAARLTEVAAKVGATATATADVTDPDAVQRAFAGLTSSVGPCDILVTCAGAATPGRFLELGDDAFREQMDLDYFGTLWCVRQVVPSMVERGLGHLVLVASTAALVGVYGYGAYAPAKYAVRGLAETLRPELAPAGITVTCVYPPDTDTPGLAAENRAKPPETAAVSAAIAPKSAEHVARAVVSGIERGRLVVTADLQTEALVRLGGLAAPMARWSVDRAVRSTQGGAPRRPWSRLVGDR